jgi:hypothetical protein
MERVRARGRGTEIAANDYGPTYTREIMLRRTPYDFAIDGSPAPRRLRLVIFANHPVRPFFSVRARRDKMVSVR